MNFSKEKFQIQSLGRNNPTQQYTYDRMINWKITMHESIWLSRWTACEPAMHLVAEKTNSLLDCVASRLKGVITPLYSALVSHIYNTVSSPGLPSTRQKYTYCRKSSTGLGL